MKLRSWLIFGGGVIAIVMLCSLVLRRSSVVPIPPLFLEPHYTYESALAAEKSQRRPILVLASASWCGPCQEFKRTALLDKKVFDAFREKAIPVYLDTDEHPDIAAELKITSIPTLYLLRDGHMISKLSGNQSASDVLDWFNAALAQK